MTEKYLNKDVYPGLLIGQIKVSNEARNAFFGGICQRLIFEAASLHSKSPCSEIKRCGFQGGGRSSTVQHMLSMHRVQGSIPAPLSK